MEEHVFQTIERKKVSLQIVDQIKKLITTGKLKPGYSLPPERELMKVFSVSRPTLREALNMLSTMGYLQMSQRQRTKVKSLIPGNITDPLQRMIKEDAKTSLELVEARSIIETGNAQLAAKRATEEDIAKLQHCIDEMRAKQDKESGLADADAEFHLAIAEATHNKIQVHLMFSIYHILKVKVGLCYYADKVDFIFDQHCDIVDAIRNRDEERAKEAMETHLLFVKNLLLDQLIDDSESEST